MVENKKISLLSMIKRTEAYTFLFFEERGLKCCLQISSSPPVECKRILVFLFTISAKDSIAIQTCELSEEEFNDFLVHYPIPPAYHVILPKSIQTIFDAPPGYVGVYTHSFYLTNLRQPITEFFCEVLEYFQPTVGLFQGFFNLFRVGKWLTFAKRPEKHIPHLFRKVINRIDEMAFRYFVYAKDEEDLSFLPNEPSPCFGTASPSVSVNIEPIRADEEPILQPAEVTTDSGWILKTELFVVHPRSVADRIKDRKCKTTGGSSRPPMKRKLSFESSNPHATCAKTSTSKDDVPFLTVSDDDKGKLPSFEFFSIIFVALEVHPVFALFLGLSNIPELKDATAHHLKISTITPLV
ncbi:hypothetical protein Tco_0377781 [Tanacetum coccineum]